MLGLHLDQQLSDLFTSWRVEQSTGLGPEAVPVPGQSGILSIYRCVGRRFARHDEVCRERVNMLKNDCRQERSSDGIHQNIDGPSPKLMGHID